MKISTVISAYNEADRIQAALASVLDQTRPPDEVILVDDGSTDGTADLVMSVYPETRVIRQSNQGISLARNRGVAEASGDYVTFHDADDLWLPRKLECQVAVAKDLAMRGGGPPALVGVRQIEVEDRLFDKTACSLLERARLEPGGRAVPPFRAVPFEGFLAHNPIGAATAMISRDVFLSLGGFDPTTDGAEDLDLWLRMAAGRPVYRIEESLYIHRVRRGSYGSNPARLSRALSVALRKWDPGKAARPVAPDLYRRACSRRVLSFAYRFHKEGQRCAAALLDEFPTDPPLASVYGFGLWCARRHGRLFSLLVQFFDVARSARRILSQLRSTRLR